jgi:hypothetical protein
MAQLWWIENVCCNIECINWSPNTKKNEHSSVVNRCRVSNKLSWGIFFLNYILNKSLDVIIILTEFFDRIVTIYFSLTSLSEKSIICLVTSFLRLRFQRKRKFNFRLNDSVKKNFCQMMITTGLRSSSW